MGRFKKAGTSKGQKINTASLPDIIFMLLFFFMVTTVMRETTLFVKISMPLATEIQKLERKSLVSFIYIGAPTNPTLGTEPRIQLNDAFASVVDIPSYIEAERLSRPEAERPMMITSMKVDKSTKMGIVTDVKQELRKVNALKINYSTLRGSEIASN
jgi:biopolymer transport protein ExbD